MPRAMVSSALADLKLGLRKRGFNEADKPAILRMARKYKRLDMGIDPETLSIMSRGLYSKSSNFFVFLGIKKGAFRDRLKVLFCNPSPPEVRYNFRQDGPDNGRKRENTIMSREYDGEGHLHDFLSRTLGDITAMSFLKPQNRYYYWPHNHAGYLHHNGKIHRLIDIREGRIPGVSGPVDDGKSNPLDMMLSAALFNGDFFAITSHNSFSAPVFSELDSLGRALGISVVPGIEFTMPISSYNPEDAAILLSNMNQRLKERGFPQIKARKGSFRHSKAEADSLLAWYSAEFGEIDFDVPMRAINGPHVVAMFEDPGLAKFINGIMLGRKDVKFPPFSAPGVELFKTMESLKLNYKDRVFLMVAHPFCDLKLPSVGIGNRMGSGDLGWYDALDIFRQGLADGIAAYNPSVKPELHDFRRMGVSLLGGYPGRFRMMLLSWIVERNSRLAESSDMIKDASRQKWGFQTLYSDALNIAYARWLAHAVNYPEAIIRMGEPDTHFYGKFDFDDVHANHLMRVVSYVEGECINKSPKGLLDALFKAKRGQGVHADYYAYAQMDREKGHLVFEESREPTRGETREEQLKYITNYGMGLFNVIIPDIVKRAFIMTGLPFSRTFYLLSKFMKE